MISQNEYEQALKIVKEYRSQVEALLAATKKHLAEIDTNLKGLGIKHKKGSDITKETKICDLSVSARLLQALNHSIDKSYEELQIEDLSKISRTEFLKLHNAGKKSLLELETLCAKAGVVLRD